MTLWSANLESEAEGSWLCTTSGPGLYWVTNSCNCNYMQSMSQAFHLNLAPNLYALDNQQSRVLGDLIFFFKKKLPWPSSEKVKDKVLKSCTFKNPHTFFSFIFSDICSLFLSCSFSHAKTKQTFCLLSVVLCEVIVTCFASFLVMNVRTLRH